MDPTPPPRLRLRLYDAASAPQGPAGGLLASYTFPAALGAALAAREGLHAFLEDAGLPRTAADRLRLEVLPEA